VCSIRGSAREIYRQANRYLIDQGVTTRKLLRHFRVLVVCTTDDPTDTLEHHIAYARSEASRYTRLFPAWRADRALCVESRATESLARPAGSRCGPGDPESG